MRVLERIVAVLTLTGGSVCVGCVLLFGSDAGLTLPVTLALVFGSGALLLLWVLRLGLHLLVTRRTPERRRIRRVVAEPVVLLLCLLFSWSGAAFWVRFMLSRPSLSGYVTTAPPTIASGSFKPGTRVGLFWLREAEVHPHGIVRVITAECGLNDCGLVYSPAGAPPVIGEDVYTALGGAWYHWFRSW
jgi:hypothetical protein